MGIPIEELNRAGWKTVGGKLVRINDGTTDIRSSAKKRGGTGILTDNPGQATKLERDFGHGDVGTVQVQGRNSGRFLVRVISIRKRLLDEDNLCEKYHIDCLRYSGILPKDSPGTARIEVSQQKADEGGAEEIKIEVYRL